MRVLALIILLMTSCNNRRLDAYPSYFALLSTGHILAVYERMPSGDTRVVNVYFTPPAFPHGVCEGTKGDSPGSSCYFSIFRGSLYVKGKKVTHNPKDRVFVLDFDGSVLPVSDVVDADMKDLERSKISNVVKSNLWKTKIAVVIQECIERNKMATSKADSEILSDE